MTLASPLPVLSEIAQTFRDRGYVVVRGLVSPHQAADLRAHLEQRTRQGTMRMVGDDLVPMTPSVYGDVSVDQLMASLCQAIEGHTGLKLYPTYSYARIYKRGDTLKPHKDRNACEISISLNLGQVPDVPWALHIGEGKSALAAMLMPGDALLYRGIDHTHWRHPFEGTSVTQVFMHYVDQTGPHAAEKFDRRAALGNAFQPEFAANIPTLFPSSRTP